MQAGVGERQCAGQKGQRKRAGGRARNEANQIRGGAWGRRRWGATASRREGECEVCLGGVGVGVCDGVSKGLKGTKARPAKNGWGRGVAGGALHWGGTSRAAAGRARGRCRCGGLGWGARSRRPAHALASGGGNPGGGRDKPGRVVCGVRAGVVHGTGGAGQGRAGCAANSGGAPAPLLALRRCCRGKGSSGAARKSSAQEQ